MTIYCRKCRKECLKSDFINESYNCYKCVYKEKVKRIGNEKKPNYCRICNKECHDNRWVYCSDECSEIGEKKKKGEHWTMKVKSVSSYSAKGFYNFRRRR